jgi:hypothetical protein
MNARATVSGALLRVLGVLGVVAGVFAMHGLTSDHEVAMAIMHAPGDVQAAMPAAHVAESQSAGHVVQHGDAVSVALVVGLERVVIAAAGEQHGMVGECLAVLTGLLLLLALALGLRSLLACRPVVLLAPAERLVLSERSPPWLAPSLSKLCVLRT